MYIISVKILGFPKSNKAGILEKYPRGEAALTGDSEIMCKLVKKFPSIKMKFWG